MLLCVLPAAAAREAVALVTLEGVSLEQLAGSNAEFRRLMESGSVGLVNNKTDGGQIFENNAVTIGAGTRGIGHDPACYGFNSSESVKGETAGMIYRRNTGIEPPDGAVVQTKLAAIKALNTYQHYDIFPGMLGSLLRKNGVRTSVYGNADQAPLVFRSAVNIAMNTEGWVEGGDVSARTLVRDPERPFGVRTDYRYILDAITSDASDRRFAVVEAGDGARLEASKGDLLPERHESLRGVMLRECGRFLVSLDRRLRAETDRYLLIFLVPTQDADAFAVGDRLTPVVFIGTDIPRGMLTTGTTKLPGVVTNIDLAPTILEFFDIEPDRSMLGSPVTATARTDAVSALKASNERMVRTLNARVPVLYGYVVCVGICVFLGIFSVLLHGRGVGCFGRVISPSFLRPALMSLMLAPAVMWIAPAFHVFGTVPSALFLAAAAVSAAAAMNKWIRDIRLILAIIGLTNAGVAAGDLVTGNALLRQTILSYDPIAGIRFYGLGNECAGVLMGSALLGVFALLDYTGRGRAWFLPAIIFAAIALIVGAPGFGSDFGGTITYLVAFGYAIMKARDIRPGIKTLSWMAGLGALMLAGIVAANMMLRPDQQTHIGRFFTSLGEGGPMVFMDTAVRKWSMNLRLMKYSVWIHFVYIFIIGLLVLFHRPVGALQRTLSRHPAMNAGFTGILTGVVVAMLTNDSGVAMAATALLYLAPPLFMMVKAEMDEAGARKA